MGLIFIGALVAVVLGGLLALQGTSDRLLAPLRTFAVVAVAATVALHILPEAIDAGGVPVLFAAVLAVVAPGAATRLATWLRQRRGPAPTSNRARRAALELAYVAIILHKITDGVGLGAAFGPSHHGHVHWEILLGIVAHTIPMAAAVALTFRADGLRAAWLRVLGLGVAIVAGALVFEGAAHGPLADATPWLNAIAAGLLLHIIVHDLPPARFAHNGARVAELAAVALGLVLPLLSGHDHGHGHASLEDTLTHALSDIALASAPAVLAGLALGALLLTFGGHLPLRWLRRGPRDHDRGALGAAARGALLGAPLPLGSCGALPVAAALEQRAAPPAAVVAVLFAAPAIGVEAVPLTVDLLGWPLAAARLALAFALAVAVALVVAAATRRRPHDDHAHHPDHTPHEHADDAPPGCGEDAEAPGPATTLGRFLRALDELVEHTGPWILVGVVAAAYVTALVPRGVFADLGWGADIALAVVIAVPAYLSATAAVPVALALAAEGLAPGAALAGLLLGPALNVATVGFLRQSYGGVASALGVGAALAFVVATALVAEAAGLAWPASADVGHAAGRHDHDHGHDVIALATLVVLGLLAIRTVWRSGLTAWVSALHGHHGHPHPTPDPVAPIDRAV